MSTTETNLRPELARHLHQRLTAFEEGFRRNLALIGPPGSGKTFQLQQLLTRERSTSRIFIYCPLYRESCRSFLHRFLCAILQAGMPKASAPEVPGATGGRPAASGRSPSRPAFRGHLDGGHYMADAPAGTPRSRHSASASMADAPEILEVLLDRAERHLPNTVSAIRQIEPLLIRRLYGEAFCRTLDTIPILTEERQAPCVLILDEFLFLEELGLVHAFHELGKRVMTWPTTLFILSSSSQYRARTILRERLQLLFGQFELLTLEALDQKATTLWVQQTLKGIRGVKAMAPFLIQWLGSYPWYLAVFLKRLRELTMLSKSSNVSEALFLKTAWDLLGSPEGTLHHWCVSRMEGVAQGRLGGRATEALIQIAEGARTTTELGNRIGRGGLSQALQLLVDHDLAQRNGMCWIVTDPILRCWLSTVLLAQRVDAHLDTEGVHQRFDHHLRALWNQWVQAHQLSFSEQVVELFEKFADDTVSLDAKTGRLPKFETIQTHRPDSPGTQVYLVADGDGKRWCAAVQSDPVDENAIADFDAFCRTQMPKPSRKVVILKSGMDPNARLLAKAANMWVWDPDELSLLMGLYAQV